jgi:hypothetical protein
VHQTFPLSPAFPVSLIPNFARISVEGCSTGSAPLSNGKLHLLRPSPSESPPSPSRTIHAFATNSTYPRFLINANSLETPTVSARKPYQIWPNYTKIIDIFLREQRSPQ